MNRTRFNYITMNNIHVYDIGGSFIYHSYPNEPMTEITLINVKFENNIEDNSEESVSNGESLIIIKEDGSGCSQLPSETMNSNMNDSMNSIMNYNNSFETIFENNDRKFITFYYI